MHTPFLLLAYASMLFVPCIVTLGGSNDKEG